MKKPEADSLAKDNSLAEVKRLLKQFLNNAGYKDDWMKSLQEVKSQDIF